MYILQSDGQSKYGENWSHFKIGFARTKDWNSKLNVKGLRMGASLSMTNG